MQKKLIALAVAGLVSAPAFAQSNVTIYGGLDMSAAGVKANGAKSVFKIDDNVWYSSRLGFRGTEDLGNGLKGIFQIEMGTLDVEGDAGSNISNGRDTFVGLQGGFGTVRLGRYLTPLGAWGGDYEATGGANQFRVDQIIGAKESIRWAFDGERVANAVSYISPNFSGLTAAALYAPDEDAGEKTDIWGVGARYDNGPMSFSAIYHEQDNSADLWNLGASYDFGVVALKAQYGQGEVDGADDKEKHWSVGLVAPVGAAGKVSLAYGEMENVGSVKDRDSDMYAVTYLHGLSKRTSLYVGYSDRDFKNSDVGDQRLTAAGVIHKF